MGEYRIFEMGMPRADACRKVLQALPEWFALESYIESYVVDTERYETFGAYDSDRALVGFVTLKSHNQFTNEIHVMAVLPEHHGRGVGSMLVSCAEQRSREQGFELLEVKTLGPSRSDQNFDKTRTFYLKAGFLPVEELHGVWPENPCLIMVMPLIGR
jgi:GNAT superfamily N-acetyltransferase